MKAKELIEQLRSPHDEDSLDSLIVVYFAWPRDAIYWADWENSEDEPRPEGTYILKEDWPAFADHIIREMDLSDFQCRQHTVVHVISNSTKWPLKGKNNEG